MPVPRADPVKRTSALFLQAIVALAGAFILIFLLVEPHLEGRNVKVTSFAEIYLKDPFLLYVYAGSVPYFVATYRALRLLGDIRRGGTCSQGTVDARRSIKHCAFTMIAFVAGGLAMILVNGDPDDRPAGVFMCFLAAFGSSAIAFVAARFEGALRNRIGST